MRINLPSLHRYCECSGFATLELLVSLGVATLLLSAIVLLFFGGQMLGVDSRLAGQAQLLAASLIESKQAEARYDFGLVNSTTSFSADGFFNQRVTVEALDGLNNKKRVTAQVSWLGERGNTKNVSLSTLVTNPQALNGGTTCNSVLSGDWSEPVIYGSVDVGQNNGGTDVDVVQKKAYVTADASSVGKADFFVVDVSQPLLSNLPIISSLNTGPGLAAVHVAGKYAYVANESATAQLQIIDLSATPLKVVSSLKMPGVSGAGSQALGKSIFYKDGFVYLGLTKTASGPEFHVIDVLNPVSPQWRGGYSINHDVNAILVRDSSAYVASPDNAELKILNIFAPNAITLIGQLDLPDNSANGESLWITGTTLYLGRTKGISPSTKELQVVNVLNTSSPSAGVALNVNSTINALAVRDNLLFLLTADTNLGFQIWDLKTGSLYASKNIQQTSTGGLDCEGDFIYVAQRSNKALQIIGPKWL